MGILDSDICPYLDFDVPRLIWLYLMKVKNIEGLEVYRFDQELTLRLSGFDCCFKS